MAELALVDAEEFPEFEASLWRRVLTGIREPDPRFDVLPELPPDASSGGGDIVAMCVPSILACAGLSGRPARSLRVLRCAPSSLRVGWRILLTDSSEGA